MNLESTPKELRKKHKSVKKNATLATKNFFLTKKEIKRLGEIESKKGLTIVAIAVYNGGHKLKLEIGIAKGKKSFDKRETIKKRETDREIRRTLKNE